MWNAWLNEAQAGVKTARGNINNLRYADETTLMAESEEELKSLLIKVKEERESWLKAQHSENYDHGIWSYHFMANSGNSNRLYFGGLQNYCRWWLQPWCLHTSKVMLKILQAELQQYMNRELPDVQAGFRKGRGTRDQISNILWIMEKQESSRKTTISALLTMPKPLTVWITINCGKFWKR